MDTKQEDSHVLLVAATDMEVKLLTEECTLIDARADNLRRYALDGFHFDLLITGIGTAFTTFSSPITCRLTIVRWLSIWGLQEV